jgi:ribosomal protein S7
LAPHKRLRLSVRWLKQLITARREWHLSQRVFAELNDVRTLKRHTLLKRRDELFSLAVTNRFNARYAY